jgi:hypothetical protein
MAACSCHPSRWSRFRDQITFYSDVQGVDRFQNRTGAHTVLVEEARALNVSARRRERMAGNRNILFLIIGALIVVVGLLGYNLYQTKKQPDGLQINVGPNGLKVQSK